MPEIDGVEATRHIKRRSPGTRVVILAVHPGLFEKAFAAGAHCYLMKDSGRQELAQAIRELGDHVQGGVAQ